MLIGIKFNVHWLVWLFPIYLLPVTIDHSPDFKTACYRAIYYAIIFTLFGLLPHELAHAFASKKFGVKKGVLHIAGFVGGWEPHRVGWCKLSRWQKNVVYAAGPTANFALYGLCSFLLWAMDLPLPVRKLVFATQILNFWMAVINLLPIYPLDGGRLAHSAITVFSQSSTVVRGLLVLISLTMGAIRLKYMDGLSYWYVTGEIILLISLSVLVICYGDIEEEKESNSLSEVEAGIDETTMELAFLCHELKESESFKER